METHESSEQTKITLWYEWVVDQIRSLHWDALNPNDLQRLMYLSYQSACEFAEALRIALKLYPENTNLKEMADWELKTWNLKHQDYQIDGDHAEYLLHFMTKYWIVPDESLEAAALKYRNFCSQLSDEVRAMTIFSREEKLPGIFERILQATDWSAPGLPEFKHYLEEHIRLDTQDWGHHDLVKDLSIDDSVKWFYEARLEMYYAINNLTQTGE